MYVGHDRGGAQLPFTLVCALLDFISQLLDTGQLRAAQWNEGGHGAACDTLSSIREQMPH